MTEPLAVIFVLLLLAAAVLFFQKRGIPRLAPAGARQVESLERLRLGPNHTLHLVRVGERRLLVATHSGGCTLLGEAAVLTERQPA